MKGKKFYFIITAVLLIGISSIYFFRKQREAQFLEFEAYEIAHVEAQVNGLYNEDKTDISEDISENDLEAIESLLEELKTKEFSRQNEKRIEEVETDFAVVKEMNHLQSAINQLFIEPRVINHEIFTKDIEDLEVQMTQFQEKSVFYNRNLAALTDAKTQLRDIERATAFIEQLFDDEYVREDVSREDEEEALTLIGKIKNKEAKEELQARAETLNLALTEVEEALALEEALAEEAALLEFEEAEEENQSNSSSNTNWGLNDSGTGWTPPTNSGGGETWTPPNPPSAPSQPTERPTPNPPPISSENPVDNELEEDPPVSEEPPTEDEVDIETETDANSN